MKSFSSRNKVRLLAVNFTNKIVALSIVKQQVFGKNQKSNECKGFCFFNFWGDTRNVLAGKITTLTNLTHLTLGLCSKASFLAAFSAVPICKGVRLPKAAGDKGWVKAAGSLGSGGRERLSGFLCIPFKGCCALAWKWFLKESKCISHLSCSSA